MKLINKEEFLVKYNKHQEWLSDRNKGSRLVWDFKISFVFLFCFKLNLRSADLSYANLHSANLRSADLRSADLHSANLRSADLRYADLRSANLRSADLSSANLRSADLSSADLRSADLSSADLDYSCWPLWCGTAKSNIKMIDDTKAQLLYHALIVQKENATKEQIEFIKKNFKRYDEVESLEEK